MAEDFNSSKRITIEPKLCTPLYNESCYPASAENEDQQQLCDQAPTLDVQITDPNSGVSDEAEPLSEDFTCIVCASVLVDPVSLHCGHSFCQLCLARLWASKSKPSALRLQCPVCRQPWTHIPGINIQLRNIVESTHKDLVAVRRQSVESAQTVLLEQFNQAKEDEWKHERAQSRQLTPEARRLICVLGLVFAAIACVMLICILMMGAWVWSGAKGEYMRKAVSDWNNEDVTNWLDRLGEWTTVTNISQTLHREMITGSQLLLLNKDILHSFGVHNEFRIQTLLEAINFLRETQFSTPRNFQEFMAAHRRQTLIIAILYKLWPRFTLLYMYITDYQNMFIPVMRQAHQTLFYEEDPSNIPSTYLVEWSQLLAVALEVVVIPHLIVCSIAWSWFNVHPWLSSAILVHAVLATIRDAKHTLTFISTITSHNWRMKIAHIFRGIPKRILHFLFTLIVLYNLWPFVPHFICDGFLYLTVWHSFATTILSPLSKCFPRQRINIQMQHNVRFP